MNLKTVKKARKDAIQATNLDASAFPLPKASVQQSVCWNPAGSIWKAG